MQRPAKPPSSDTPSQDRDETGETGETRATDATGVADAAAPGAAAPETGDDSSAKTRPDPTRYGDWEKDGRCIDF